MNFELYALQLCWCCMLIATICGCVSRRPLNDESVQRRMVSNGEQTIAPEYDRAVKDADLAQRQSALAVKEEETRKLREKSEKGWLNEEALKDFALRESPSLWGTVQAIRAQVTTRRKSLTQLKAELLEFNVMPDNDLDFVRLQKDIDSMLDGLAGIFKHIEEACIAAKKREAVLGNGNYDKAMKRALKDGIAEAEGIANRYLEMTKTK